MTEATNHLYFTSRQDWRAWLEKNHALEKEAWLVHYKKHTGKYGLSYEDAVEEALCFGWIDGLLKSLDSERYALRYSPRKSKAVWAESNKKRVEKLIAQGLMTEAGLKTIRQAKENGEWDNATWRETLEIPPDLAEALASRKGATQNFQRLTSSRQKQLIWWITSAKRKETREKRINETIQLIG